MIINTLYLFKIPSKNLKIPVTITPSGIIFHHGVIITILNNIKLWEH